MTDDVLDLDIHGLAIEVWPDVERVVRMLFPVDSDPDGEWLLTVPHPLAGDDYEITGVADLYGDPERPRVSFTLPADRMRDVMRQRFVISFDGVPKLSGPLRVATPQAVAGETTVSITLVEPQALDVDLTVIGGVTPGDTAHTVGAFAADFDPTGSFTTVPLHNGATIPRAYLSGADVLIVDGDHLGIWTIPASGAATAGAALAPGDVIAAANGLAGIASATDGVTVDRVVVQATEDYAAAEVLAEVGIREAADTALNSRLAVLEAEIGPAADDALRATDLVIAEASERARTAPTFAFCSPGSVLGDDDHHDYAWQIDPPANFTTGAWARWDDLIVVPWNEPIPSPSTRRFYSELATQTGDDDVVVPPDDPGIFDIREDAAERRWDSTFGRWVSSLYMEWTEEGDSVETYTYSTAGQYDLPEGVPVTIARWLEFNVDGQFRLRWFERVNQAEGDITLDGARWRTVASFIGTGGPTNIAPDIPFPWGYGYGAGRVHATRVQERDAGPDGTLLVDLVAQDAADANDGSFTDGVGNTVTPGAQASTTTPSAGGGAVDSVNGQTGTVVLDAADVGAAADDDARLTDTRTPTDGSVTAAKLDAALAARIHHTVRASSDLGPRTHPTFTIDDILQFPCTSGVVYWIEGFLVFQGDATADLRLNLSIPSGAYQLKFQHPLTTVAGTSDYDRFTNVSSSPSNAVSGIAGATTPIAVSVSGWVAPTADGTVGILWGASSAGAGTGVTRLANSFLRYGVLT